MTDTDEDGRYTVLYSDIYRTDTDEDGRYTVLYSDVYRTDTDEDGRYTVPILFLSLITVGILLLLELKKTESNLLIYIINKVALLSF